MRWRRFAGVGALCVALLTIGVGSASAQQQHGIAFVKGCQSPVNVGGPYLCAYQILNVIDGGQDTIRVSGLSDQVHAASGDVNSGNMLGSLQLVFSAPTVTCTGGSGAGTSSSPYIGATSCLLPFGTTIATNSRSFYTVQSGDFGLPSHLLTDTASLSWNNTCTAPNIQNCTTNGQTGTAPSSATVQQLGVAVTTQIHNAAHQVVTAIPVGGTVHDFVTVTGSNGGPTPTGNVTVDWFLNGDCSNGAVLTSSPTALVNGQVDVTGFAFTVNAAGMRAFRANYAGDGTYPATVGPCEPLAVVDANIQITPQTATNPIGTNHTLTGHVNVNSGAGFVNAPAGTTITFAIVSGPGSFVGGVNQCTTSNGSGSCTVQITSGATGTTVVKAATDVTVAGVPLHRETGDANAGDSANANKTWVTARIAIAPSATNEVGASHTFTVTLEKDLGNGTFVPAANEHVDVTLTDTNGAAHTAPSGSCTQAGANTNAAGQCTITFTSPTAGKVTGHASATLSINGSPSFTVQTNGVAPNSGDAVKTFVDANIQITPQTATNPTGTNHTLTGHVNVNDGSGAGFGNAPAGTTITFSLTNQNGATAVFVGPSSCTTANGSGSCTVVISSPTGGTTKIHATTTVVVGGVSLTRATGDTHAGDSPDATKTWGGARISITPSATNEVGVSHTFTVLLEKDTGGGFQPAAGEHVDVTLTDSNGAAHTAPTGTCTQAGANTNAAGQCTITFTSPTPGKVTGRATATLNIGGASVTVSTNGTGGTGDAVKTFVDANIQITPANAFNQVGTNHTLTGHVNINAGDGAGFVNAPTGTTITFTKVSGPGSFVNGVNTCTTTNGSGSCTVQITSTTTGTTAVSAATTVTVGGVSLTRATGDAHAGDSANANKTWENARISIAPSATNEIGVSHTFTVTLEKDTGTGTFVPATGEHVDVTLTDSNGAVHTAPTGTCTAAGANTNGTGSCTITFTSQTPGRVTGHATATLVINGVSITVQTNGVAPNSGDAVKTFVDANIQITPQTATNPVGTNHTLTGHVNVNAGTGAGFVNAPAGTTITYSLTNAGGATATFVGPSSCTTANGSGSCTVVISSPTTGTTTIGATTTVSVGGVSLTRATGDSHVGDGPNATKTWTAVGARISITPNATNEINAPHTFTVLLEKNLGNGTFVPAAGEHVNVTLTDSNGATHSAPTGTCTTAGANTNAAGQCLITFTSPTAGKVTGHASATLTINGLPITVQTDGANGNSGDAVKTFVDANIQITPQTATNPVGTNHTLTGHVNVNAGDGAGFVNAPAGTTITFSLTNAGGATATFVGPSSCTTANGSGSCTVVISSPTTGTTTIHASTTVSVGGVSLTRATGDGKPLDSADAQKTWGSAQISIAPNATNEVGVPHTFTVTVQKNVGAGLVAAAGVHVDVTLTDSNGAVHSAPIGSCTTAGANTDAAGQCVITFSSPSAGKVTGTATAVVPINGSSITVSTNGVAPNSGPAVKTFVDANIQINPPTATNPVGTNHTLTSHVNVNAGAGAGFVNAPDGTVINHSLINSGGASAAFVGPSTCQTSGGTGSCTVVISSPTAGSTTIHAATTVSVSGVSLTRATGDSHPGDGPDAVKDWTFTGPCPTGPLGGINIGGLTKDLFFFADGRTDANWQSASPGFAGDVTVNGLLAKERTSGSFAYAGTISTNDTTLSAWQKIVDNNQGQAFAKYSQTALVTSRNNELNAAFQQINALPVTQGFANRSTASLDGLNFQNGINERIVINVTSGFQVSKQLNIFGDAGDVIILRWDSDQNFANGYQGQVKFQSGGAIVPKGGLTPGNFISVAGDINSSGGGKTPPPPYPQGPRLGDNGTGALISGAKDFSGGGFFTGYWLTTGSPTNPADATHVLPYGDTASQSNGIFVGGWYTFTTKFSMTSGTSGVHVCPNPTALRAS